MNMNFEVALHVDVNSIRGVLSAVRNKALEWVIDLERHGVVGHSFSFTEKEKERAGSMTIDNSFGSFTGVFGNQNSVRDIRSGPTSQQLTAIIKEMRRYTNELTKDGIERKSLLEAIDQLESASTAQSKDKAFISEILSALRDKLAEAGGSAAAVGLLHMIQGVLS